MQTTATRRDASRNGTSTRRGAVLAVMCAGMFLVLLDVTIVNVALPAIGHGLHAGVPQLQWVVDGYAVVIAGLLLAGGTVGDRIGHRRVLLAGFAVFGAASVGCAAAPAAGVLVAARAVQGLGGALLLPTTMAVIADVFPERREQSRALGMWAAVSSLALPAGPLLGGVLVATVSWRLVFWINVPLVLVTVLAARRVVPAARGRVGGLGHRRVLLAGFAVFGAASVGCAAAPAAGVLVAARAVQGLGGALLLPTTMAVIADVFPERREQSRALGMWAAVSSLALPAGPLLGGVLVATVSWRLVFWINVPLVLGTVLAARRVVPAARGRVGGRLDIGGLLTSVVALAGFVFTIIQVGRGAPVPVVAASAAVTVAAGLAAFRFERAAEQPILPLDLLRRPRFVSPNAVALTMNLVFNGLLFVLMLYLQDVLGRSALVAGLYVLPLAVPLVLLAPVSGRLTALRGPRSAVALGCLTASAGAALLLGVRTTGGTGWLLAGFAVLGCGAGLVTASVVAAAVQATPADRSGLATGVSNTARQVGTATGVALFGAVAGSPADAASFVSSVHALAVVGAVLWLAAFVVAMRGIAHLPRQER